MYFSTTRPAFIKNIRHPPPTTTEVMLMSIKILKLRREKGPQYPLAKVIGEDFIIVGREELLVQ